MKGESERILACWCTQADTTACDMCVRKVYYPEALLTGEPVQFFEADEEEGPYYPV